MVNKKEKFTPYENEVESDDPFIEAKTIFIPPKKGRISSKINNNEIYQQPNETYPENGETMTWNLDNPLSPEEFEQGGNKQQITIAPNPIYNQNITPYELESHALAVTTAGKFQPVAPKRIGEPSHELVMVLHPDSIAADQFRLLRFKILESGRSQVVGVTSSHRGEGKSVVAGNLALSLSESGRNKVLLIDTCLRTPRLAAMFGVGEDFGLSTELQNKHADPSAIPRVIGLAEALYLLPAGPPVPNPTAILGSDVMIRLITELRASFDHIVLDISSVLDHSDANVIYDCVDSFIITVMAKKTKSNEVEQTFVRLTKEKILGTVLIGGFPEH